MEEKASMIQYIARVVYLVVFAASMMSFYRTNSFRSLVSSNATLPSLFTEAT